MEGMASSDFVHLHVHTDYSILDGAAKVARLVEKAAENGQSAVAITDHGYLFGAYEFYAAAVKTGVKPIIGLEAYVTPGTSRFDTKRVHWGTLEQQKAGDDVSANGAYTHMTLLSRTTEGMHNLFRLGSLASIDGQMGKWPRLDRELLQRYAGGLVGTSGCPSGEVQVKLRLGLYDEALRTAGELQDIFGKEFFYIELMDHGLSIERRVREDLLRLAKALDAPLLATNDSHYVNKEDREIQDAMLCINSGDQLNNENRFRFDGTDYYLRPSNEMRELFRDLPQACDNTLLVAEQCEVKFSTVDDGASFMPKFQVPAGENEESWFVKEVERGLNYRYPQGITEAVRKRADYEVGIILQMGFAGYFLVVSDYIQWAKQQGIRVGPGRGSGAGSMVAYAMRITDLDPLQHGLLFERFLNPERVSMPDIDVDFDDRRRAEVIEYVTRKYGKDKIAQVVTYGTIKTKQALKDAARISGAAFSVGENLTKALPPAAMGKDIPLSQIYNKDHPRYKEAEEFRKVVASTGENQAIFSLASGVEGMTRQWGVHACAVIMSSHTLTDIIPMMKRLQDGAIITQFDYPTCEHLGLLKMDFLGLKNLTIISDALDNIKLNGKTPPDLEHLPIDDRATYELLSSGETLGVFQLDGGGMRTLLKQLRPTEFDDISALVALYRPGPMGADSHTNYALRKNGAMGIKPIHPELADPLKDILGYTYGLIIYQEQVMAIAQKVAGFTLGQADILRKAMGKKKKDVLDKQYVKFHDGMLGNGYSEDCCKTLWDILVPFADYAFNKSHSAAYGLIAYWTAYLKANFPTEYMAAVLTTQTDKDKLGMYLNEVRRMGIRVLPPDVNASVATFAPDGADIRFGLASIRNVGEGVVEGIIKSRRDKGAYTSFQDFLNKVPAEVCNKRAIESLIKAGAFDAFGVARRALVAVHEEAVDSVISLKRQESKGQFDLFASLDGGGDDLLEGFSVEIPALKEWPKKDKLAFERQMLGLYVSDHPLSGMENVLRRLAADQIIELTSEDGKPNDAEVRIAGLITSVEHKTSKRTGQPWAIARLEDMSGAINVLFFPKTYETVGAALEPDRIVTVGGRLKREDESASVFGQDLSVPDITARLDHLDQVELLLPQQRCTWEAMNAFGDLMRRFPGEAPVRLHVWDGHEAPVLELDQGVNAGPDFLEELRALLGNDVIVEPGVDPVAALRARAANESDIFGGSIGSLSPDAPGDTVPDIAAVPTSSTASPPALDGFDSAALGASGDTPDLGIPVATVSQFPATGTSTS
ncbi:DNA polymerase III subunit alpha [Mobiluncus mulieris]|nr:DNA polymerase III, alpha subunit [Mobiluncus mulieris ATCC 35243]SPX76084.1 DNA polymerase III subunit alpha [Mobiluncus mulieris]